MAAALGLAVATSASARVEGDAIVLGAALSLTGAHSAECKHLKDGYDLAVKEINRQGGVTVRAKSYELQIKYYDDESDPKRTAALLDRLVRQDEVTFLLGPCGSEAAGAAALVIEKSAAPVIQAGPVSRSLFQKGYRYFFAVPPGPERYLADSLVLAEDAARAAGRNPADVRVALASGEDASSLEARQGLVERLSKDGMRIVFDDRLGKDLSHVRATFDRVKALAPDALFVLDDPDRAPEAAGQIPGLRARVPFVAMTHCDAADLPRKAGSAAEGIVCPARWAEGVDYRDRVFRSAREYARLFRATFLEYASVPPGAAQGSAAVEVWKDALERAQSFDGERLRNAIAATDLDTFFGRIRFDGSGRNTGTPMALRQIRNGEYVVIAPGSPPRALK